MPSTNATRLLLTPGGAPGTTIDLTEALTRTVAFEIWRATGGNAVVNWLEAERFVERLARRGARAAVEPKPRGQALESRVRRAERRRAESRLGTREEFAAGPIPLR